MTVVAALARDGIVTMAADCAAGGGDTQVLGVRKIRRLHCGDEPALLTCEGHGGIACVLAREWQPGTPPVGGSVERWQEWADEAASSAGAILFNAEPPLTGQNDGAPVAHDAALLAVAGKLIYIYTHQAVVVHNGPAALGSGADMALGYLHGAGRSDPQTAVGAAVELACRYVVGCSIDVSGPQVEQLGAGK